jgi:hypothetical protein
MKSFRRKFEGREIEILSYINEHGGRPISYTIMEHFGARDTIAWGRYCDEISEIFNFEFVEADHTSLAGHYREPIIQYVADSSDLASLIKIKAAIDCQIACKRKRLEEIEQQIVEAATAEDYVPERVGIPI